MMRVARGIGGENRKLLDVLHRKASGPFTVVEAAEVLDLDRGRTKRLLAQFASQGWLSRIRRDSYAVVPLGATSPSEWREDPWAVATKAFAPCYLGGWTACEHWGLTEQLFRGVVVMTGKRPRVPWVEIQGTRFNLKYRDDHQRFGTKTVWRGKAQIQISDPSRTIVDILDDPATGGGVRHVAEILRTYFAEATRKEGDLLDYARRLGNRTVFKRLGYLVEACGIEAPRVVGACQEAISAGISLLDTSGKPGGRITKRWNLRVNVHVGTEDEGV